MQETATDLPAAIIKELEREAVNRRQARREFHSLRNERLDRLALLCAIGALVGVALMWVCRVA